MKTIRIQLHGGLGNQLFIWAAAHDLAQKNKCKVKLVYIRDKQQRLDRPVELREIEAICKHSISVNTSKLWGMVFKVIDKLNSLFESNNLDYGKIFGIYSLANSYDVLDKLPANTVMIRGYFQDSKMVDCVTEDLVLEISKTLNATDIEEKYIAKQSLHIRRGDTTSIAASWGILTLNYFNKYYISNQKTVLCTDSDEIQNTYSLKHPNIIISTDVTHNSWQTLKILTEANRFIGSNSTLSWWAAWFISQDKNKVAILPHPWRPHDMQVSTSLVLDKVKYELPEFEEMGT
jgi:hypothetical protein